MSTKVKNVSQPLPMLKNVGGSPFIYFDSAPVHGVYAAHIEVELAARMLLPKPDGSVQIDMASTAHLRCSLEGAMLLRQALDEALQMAAEQQKRRAAQENGADKGDDRAATH